MPSSLQRILDRLVKENLPANYLSHELPTNVPSIKRLCSYSPIDDKFDVDTFDPRWQELFVEFFLNDQDDTNDDMLFFVRHLSPDDLSDPVFVKRKQKDSSMPAFDDPVLWKETFFLNLIVQLNCKLRVSICKRGVNANQIKSSLESSGPKFLKTVTKRVYALPSRSRVDVKESEWECSYPLIYYAVEDHDDMFEQLTVDEDEHLCVELLCSLTDDSDQDVVMDSLKTSQETVSFLAKRPPNTVSLFQGAASFTSLLSVLKQKLALKPPARAKVSQHQPRQPEYIIMRGPEGKGHAQVAMSLTHSVSPSPSTCLNDRSYNDSKGDFGSPEPPKFGGPTSFLQSLKRLSLAPLIARGAEPAIDPLLSPILSCSITFVNIPWTSIICNLLNHIAAKPRDL